MQVRIGWLGTFAFVVIVVGYNAQSFALGTDCGNGICDGGENSCNCPDDCDPNTCIAGGGISSGTFPFDASNDSNTCLNTLRAACCSNVAAAGSSCSCLPGPSCIGSVICAAAPACGDGTCDPASENCSSCPSDCGPCTVCGDGTCGPACEDDCNCPQDCPRTSCDSSCACTTLADSGCNCDAQCSDFGDCCPDACTECGQCPAANDLCEGAISVGIPSTTTGNTSAASVDSSFPACSGAGTPSAGGVWYSVTGNGNTLTASLCNPGTNYDTKLTVYCPNCTAPACVAGNDDFCGFPPGHSQVSWCSASGETYLILVHGFGGSTGQFELTIANGAACANPVSCGVQPVCGNGNCGKGETCENCPADCGPCGACCNFDDVVAGGSPIAPCQVTSPGFCELNNGEYQGDGTRCGGDICDPRGACCHSGIGKVAGPNGFITFCDVFTESTCNDIGGTYLGDEVECHPNSCARDQRLSTVKKGSLLIFPKVELRWDNSGKLTQDTILTLVNDFTKDVHVKLYFENGDMPTDAVYADDLQTILVERAHNGWNDVDCVIELTENESTYLVMSTGVGGCQRFTILDPGTPPGRPNLEPDGGRVLRGVVYAFAVDEEQNEISHNHLSGHADLVHYGLRSAWEYQAYAFQATNPSTGTWTDTYPGQINLDGVEYDYAFNTLLFDFFAVGSTAFSNGGVTVMLDTDLTLHPVSQDFRQDSCGPITTKAHFDIWNANEDFRSGTARCITCWDQTLLSAYSDGNGLDNNFILADLGTDKGKARIDGMQSFECDNLFVPPNLDDAILQWLLLHDRTCEMPGTVAEGQGKIECCYYTINDSQNAALLGVAAKVLSFSGGAIGRTFAGMNLVGAGQESAQILFDIPAPPETASNGEGRRTNKNAGQRSSLGQMPDK